MKQKTLVTMIVTLVSLLSFALVVYGNVMEEFQDDILRQIQLYEERVEFENRVRIEASDESIELQISEGTLQIVSLWELFLSNHPNQINLTRLDSRFETDFVIPNITFFATPELGQPHFRIGLESEPTDRDIEFILDFTGIPRDRVQFNVIYFVRQGLSIEDLDPENPLHQPLIHSLLYAETYMHTYYDANIEYYGLTLYPTSVGSVSMGQMIFVPSIGSFFTVGHPTNNQGRTFVTAPHRAIPHQMSVLLSNRSLTTTGSQIGNLTGSIFNNQVDVGFITTLQNITISTNLPDLGMGITNFRATPFVDSRVRSYRGMSGVQITYISSTNGTVEFQPGDIGTNKILTFHDGVSQSGDSGAALIRVGGINVEVLGTRAGLGRSNIGFMMGVYTPTTRY